MPSSVGVVAPVCQEVSPRAFRLNGEDKDPDARPHSVLVVSVVLRTQSTMAQAAMMSSSSGAAQTTASALYATGASSGFLFFVMNFGDQGED